MRVAAALLAGFALAGCGGDRNAQRNEAEPAPAPKKTVTAADVPVANTPGALPAPEFAGGKKAAGSWMYKDVAGGAAALFGPPESEARFIVRCDPDSHQIVFVVSGSVPSADAMLHIATDTGAAAFPAHKAATQLPEVQAESSPTFPFVSDNLGGKPERIAVKLGDGPALVMPGDPAIGRVIRSCRG